MNGDGVNGNANGNGGMGGNGAGAYQVPVRDGSTRPLPVQSAPAGQGWQAQTPPGAQQPTPAPNTPQKKGPRTGVVVALALVVLAVAGFAACQLGGGAKENSSATAPAASSSSSAEASESESASASEAVDPASVDVSDLVGEKWSNAKKILERRGVDPVDVVVLTDDGKDVWDDSNWTVAQIGVEDGTLTAHLTHDDDPMGSAVDTAGNAVDTAKDKAQEYADKAKDLADQYGDGQGA